MTLRRYAELKMRPPERINEILELLDKAWKKDPDMRFLQLVYVLQSMYSHLNDGRGKILSPKEHYGSLRIGYDLFAIEDTELISLLREYIDNGYPKA